MKNENEVEQCIKCSLRAFARNAIYADRWHSLYKYNISRSSIQYWMKKLTNFENKSNTMSKNDEIKKLKGRIEELEFVKDFQQDVIADFENITGEHLSKKYFSKQINLKIILCV